MDKKRRLIHLLYTATFWGSLFGLLAFLCRQRRLGATILAIVGWGGLGIVYSDISQTYRKGYSDIRAFNDLAHDLLHRNPPPKTKQWLEAAALHVVQAIAGTCILLTLPKASKSSSQREDCLPSHQ